MARHAHNARADPYANGTGAIHERSQRQSSDRDRRLEGHRRRHRQESRRGHGDRAVLKAQEWVHMRDGRGVSLAAMATAAGLERRTLLRRFASATGMSPIEYCRAVRIARARELLEGGDTSQKQIAQSL